MKIALGFVFCSELHWLDLHLPVWMKAEGFDGIVAVDSFSSDGSRDYALEATPHVFRYEGPKHDYGALFNALLGHARELGFDAILRLDPDELMFPSNMSDVAEELRTGALLVKFSRWNFEYDRLHTDTYSFPDYQGRAFCLHPKMKYSGALHENVWGSATESITTGVSQIRRPSICFTRTLDEELSVCLQWPTLKYLITRGSFRSSGLLSAISL